MINQLFFKSQIQQKWHQTIAMVPLDIYPYPRAPSAEITFEPFDKEVQYFLIEDSLTSSEKNQSIQMASRCLEEKTAFVSKHQKSGDQADLIITLLTNEQEAIIKQSSYFSEGGQLWQSSGWKGVISPQLQQFIEKIINYSRLGEFTGLTLKAVLISKEIKLKVLVNAGKHQFLFQFILQQEICFQYFIQKIMTGMVKYISKDPSALFHKTISLCTQQGIIQYFDSLSWTQKVKCIYLIYQQLGLTFHQGKLVKAKQALYSDSICKLIEQGMLDSLSNITTELLQQIIKQSAHSRIHSLFRRLYETLDL